MHIRIRISLLIFFMAHLPHVIAPDPRAESDWQDRKLGWKKVPKDRNTTGRERLALVVGDALTLKCRKALEIEKIDWFLTALNQTVELTKKHLRSLTGQRIIRSGKEMDFTTVQLSDTGSYSCQSGNVTRHVFHVHVDEIHSMTDFRSPYNCLLVATVVVVILFALMWCKKSRANRQIKGAT